MRRFWPSPECKAALSGSERSFWPLPLCTIRHPRTTLRRAFYRAASFVMGLDDNATHLHLRCAATSSCLGIMRGPKPPSTISGLPQRSSRYGGPHMTSSPTRYAFPPPFSKQMQSLTRSSADTFQSIWSLLHNPERLVYRFGHHYAHHSHATPR